MIDDYPITSTITVRKTRLTAEQRAAAKALLLDIDPTAILSGGQLILHFGPGRNPFFSELQERADKITHQLQKVS